MNNGVAVNQETEASQEIEMSQDTEIENPRIRKIVVRAAREAELAIEKVAANFEDSRKFPLSSDATSLERILATRFSSLPQRVRQAAATKAISRIMAPAAVRSARFGDLASVDLTTATAIDAQVKALPFPEDLKLSKDDVNALTTIQRNIPASAALVPRTNKLELRIHKVKCIDETDGFLGSEAGSDEIKLGGTAVDETGDTHKINAFLVGEHFEDGVQKVFSPLRQFTSFDLKEGTAFPKSYFVTLVLAEEDMGGIPDFLNDLLKNVKDRVTTALGTAIGGAIGASGGPVGAIIGAAVGLAVGLIINFLKSVWQDDIFDPVTVSISIPSLSHRFAGGKTDSPEIVVPFVGHGGKYQVTCDWRLFS